MKTNQPTLKTHLARIVSIFFGMLTFLMLSSCGRSTADKPNSEIFTLMTKSQSHFQIDVGEEGHSHGDIRIFEGLLTEKNENVVGRYTAMQNTVSLAQKSDNSDEVHEDRFRTIIFEFDDGSTMIATGISHFTVGEPRFAMNDPRVRAIIGGTGKYVGARGQITTTRIGEFLYEVKFEILP